MKRFLPLGVTAALAIPLLAATLPFAENFNSGTGEFTILDANEDGNKIITTVSGGQNYTQGLYYNGNENPADEWLITPSFELKKGYIYELAYSYKTGSSNTLNRVEWKAGNAPTAEAMTIAVAPVAEYSYEWGSWKKVTINVSVPEDGDYYLGMHLISDAKQASIYFDNISVEEIGLAAAPIAPSVKAPVFTVEGDAINASFEITFPNVNAGGDALEEKEMEVKVSRSDSDDTATVKGMPGATVNYTDPNASAQSVNYTFVGIYDGIEGPATTVASAPTFGYPKAVEGFAAVQDGNHFTLSWDAVTEATNSSYLFIPSSVTYLVKCNGVTVAENTPELTVEYTYPMPEEGQEAVSFTIVAIANGKQSSVFTSASMLVGNPYVGEFAESFANRSFTNKTWVVDKSGWSASSGGGYSPAVSPQDADGGCLEFAGPSGEERTIWSPILDLSSLQNPKLKFWVFLNPSTYTDVKFQPAFYVNGESGLLGDEIHLQSGDAQGWTEFTYDVPAEALQSNSQLMFIGYGSGTSYKIYVDNITIRSYLDHNLAVSVAAPAKSLEVGQSVNFPVTIRNKGVNDEENYMVKLLANGVEVSSVEGLSVESLSEVVVEIPFQVLPKYAGTDVEFTVVAEMDADMEMADNEAEVTIPVNENELECATNLTATPNSDLGHIVLTWDAPAVSNDPVYSETTESFEEWESASIEAQNGWIFIDADGETKRGINSVNRSAKFAAMVVDNYDGGAYGTSIVAYDGVKCLGISPNSSYSSTAPLDCWIISPVVKGGSDFSFYAETLGASYSTKIDSFRILYSTGGSTPEDFIELETKSVNNKSWSEISVTLPEDAQRVAINVNKQLTSDALLFDKFTFTEKSDPAVHTGFNLYRDHSFLATYPADTMTHTDTAPVQGQEHTYHVTALYDKGESLYSDPVNATVATPVGIVEIDANEAGAQYYDLNGLRLDTPVKGQIVIVRKGAETFKALIK